MEEDSQVRWITAALSTFTGFEACSMYFVYKYLGEKVASEAVLGIICHADGFLLLLELEHRHCRPESLFPKDLQPHVIFFKPYTIKWFVMTF